MRNMDEDRIEKLVKELRGGDDENFVHEQTDSGFGYKCDRGVKNFLIAFNRNPGVRSICSCESCKDLHWLWVEFYATPRALYQIAKAFKNRADIASNLEIWLGHRRYGKHSVHASLTVRPDCEDAAIALLGHLEKYPVSVTFAFLPRFLQVLVLCSRIKLVDPTA